MGKYETVTNTSNCAPSFIDIGRFSIGHQISSPKRKTSSWYKLSMIFSNPPSKET